MPAYNAAVARVPMIARIAKLPVSPGGFPIPYFVCKDPLDFRVIQPGVLRSCVKQKRCWVCGDPLGKHVAFVAGPMCGINRTSAEPPSHRDCAEWSAKACPFLTQPRMRRNETNLPANGVPPPGIMLRRNPGVALVWITRSYRRFQAPNGWLFEMGEPLEVLWFAEGRAATRAEVTESLRTGLPLLEEHVHLDHDPAGAARDLAARAAWLDTRLPAAPA